MPSLKDIKKRIGSVKNTQQITKAMKMVSAAKLRRAQDAVVAARPYADKMLDVLSNLKVDMLEVSLGDASSSALITIPENDDFKYVVMPMRI